MAKYTIVTDSASDISQAQADKWGVSVIKLTYLLNEKLYVNNPDHSEMSVPDFYKALREGAKVSTSAANIGDFTDFFTPILESGSDILYICFSSALSATYQNALNAASELKSTYPARRIEVVDSLCASFGQGLLVYLCSQKQSEGAELDELTSFAEETKHKVCHEFTVDDLDQLKRGGRLSFAKALVGKLLHIKPMLFVSKEGKLVSYGTVRSRGLSLRKLADMTLGEMAYDESRPIFISHGDCEEEANALMAMINEVYPKQTFVCNYIGPVIGAHSGYKTMAIFCLGESRGDARLQKKN